MDVTSSWPWSFAGLQDCSKRQERGGENGRLWIVSCKKNVAAWCFLVVF